MKFLQLNLGRGKGAQDFLMQTARETEVDVYSCYFSPHDPFEIFETQILLLEESLREARGRSLITGDFSSKSPEWGEACLDRRGILVGEMAARIDLIVLNGGRDFTFRLLDTMGKLLEEMILQRLEGHMVHENGLSENQFGFPKGRSTVDAIQAVVDIATKARRGTGKRKGFCALISIDIRNAFNTAR